MGKLFFLSFNFFLILWIKNNIDFILGNAKLRKMFIIFNKNLHTPKNIIFAYNENISLEL